MPGDNYRYDLRSTAVDVKRDRDTKRKWGAKALNRQREGRSPTPGADKVRPFVERQTIAALKHAPRHSADTLRQRTVRRHKGPSVNMEDDRAEGDASGSADSDLWSEDGVPEDEGTVMYSYDAQKGPSSGHEVFGSAVGSAVKRFEDGVTTRLVKDEYDVLDDACDDGGDEKPSQTVDEDFEML